MKTVSVFKLKINGIFNMEKEKFGKKINSLVKRLKDIFTPVYTSIQNDSI